MTWLERYGYFKIPGERQLYTQKDVIFFTGDSAEYF